MICPPPRCNYFGMPCCARFALLLFVLTAACTTDDTTPTPEDQPRAHICDGSQDLRLAWFLSSSGGVVRTPFQFELGFSYLYVRGDCEYWVLSSDAGIVSHHGVLDEDQAAALEELVHYGEWEDLTQLWPEPGTDDAGLMVVDDGQGEYQIGCLGECPVAPEPVRQMQAAYRGELERLWDEGEPYTGPMRVLTAKIPEGDMPDEMFVVPWTVDLDLASVAVDFVDMGEPGMSVRIADQATLEQLRAFRDQHADALEQFTDFFVEVEPGVVYELYVRDSVPFEGNDGLLARYWGD